MAPDVRTRVRSDPIIDYIPYWVINGLNEQSCKDDFQAETKASVASVTSSIIRAMSMYRIHSLFFKGDNVIQSQMSIMTGGRAETAG